MMSSMNFSQYYWGHWWLRGTCYYDPMAEYMDYMNQMREYEEELTRELACMNGKITSRVHPSAKEE